MSLNFWTKIILTSGQMAVTIGISCLVCDGVLVILLNKLQINELLVIGDLLGNLLHSRRLALGFHLLFCGLSHYRLDYLFFRVWAFLLRWLALFLLGRIWRSTVDLDDIFRFLDFVSWCCQIFRQCCSTGFLLVSPISFGSCLFCCSLSPGTRH